MGEYWNTQNEDTVERQWCDVPCQCGVELEVWMNYAFLQKLIHQ